MVVRKPRINAHPKKRGPKERPIDLETIKLLASIQCTQEEMAAAMKLQRRAFINRINADPNLREIIEDGLANGRMSVRRQQFKLMQDGNVTMAIWLGKQYLNQRDQPLPDMIDKPDGMMQELANAIRQSPHADQSDITATPTSTQQVM
jgi:predicted DNA-binding protein (UPF0251 family)